MNEKEYLDFIEQWKEDNKELIDSGKCKHIFLECLPKPKKNIAWKLCKNYKVYFIYECLKGWVEIIDYTAGKLPKIEIEYNGKRFNIFIGHFTSCKLGNFLMLNTSEFKIEIDTRFQDDKRDISIIDRKKIKDINGREWKCYKYRCNICGFACREHYNSIEKENKEELWVLESSLIGKQNVGCSCCSGNKIVVEHINSIVATDKWMIPYFKGGYDEAKLYTHSSNKRIYPICPICNTVKYKSINISTIYNEHSIGCSCSDSVSYGEKIIFSCLKQLKLNFKTQLNKITFKWCDKYKYDFYFELDNEQYICEVNGLQHYEETSRNGARTLEQEHKNDIYKEQLALKNGIKEENYIVIDCRKSELEWIKNNDNGILNSRLNELFDLSKIDWLKAEEFTCSNLVKIACNYKRDNQNMSTGDIGKIMKYNFNTVCSWLKKGNLIGWCSYNAKEERYKGRSKSGKMNAKPIEIFKYGQSLGMFESSREIDYKSEKLFGVHLNYKGISEVAIGKKLKYKGYEFNYLTQEEYNRRVHEENLKQAI